ncbi:MAG: PEP-CTERM sorting domain-containing protein [Leptolyngbya sp. SIO1D8]|nr:PEP-CTERM sorting domain-containing protein [Leptolyngbya sp. SIO1D8]
MIKNVVLTAAAIASLGVMTTAPAFASGGLPTKSVPEPLTILGSLAAGGGIVAKKIADAKKK